LEGGLLSEARHEREREVYEKKAAPVCWSGVWTGVIGIFPVRGESDQGRLQRKITAGEKGSVTWIT